MSRRRRTGRARRARAGDGAPRGPRHVLSRIGYWTPVWLPLLGLYHVTLLGMRPALAEARWLDAEEARLRERYEALRAQSERLELRRAAQTDPVYVERERRALRAGR